MQETINTIQLASTSISTEDITTAEVHMQSNILLSFAQGSVPVLILMLLVVVGVEKLCI